MKKIIDFLSKNGMNFTEVKYGNPYYFNDGFSVDGVKITFDYYLDPEASRKMAHLEKFMKSRRAYNVVFTPYGSGYSCRIMTVFDAARLEKHQNAITEATEKFWQNEHMRRMQKAV